MRKMSVKEVQDVSLEILLIFDRFCREHGLRYCLAEGTMLGAVRHHGFIPWDDDIDVLMPRPDYERFLTEYVDTPQYRLFSCYRGACAINYARLCEMQRTRMVPTTPWCKHVQGIGVDILPLNGAPDNPADFDLVIDRTKRLREDLLELRALLNPKSRFGWRKDPVGLFKDTVHCFERCWRRLTFAREVAKIADRQVALQRERDYETSTYCYALMVFMNRKFFWRTEWFKEMTEVDFEGHRLPIPSGWHEYLQLRYGDYMKLPPESERGGHCVWQTQLWVD